MSKLDENYLDLVRERLYSAENVLPSKPVEKSSMVTGKYDHPPSKKTKKQDTGNKTESTTDFQCKDKKAHFSEVGTSKLKVPRIAKTNKSQIIATETRGVKRKPSIPTLDERSEKPQETKKSKHETPVSTETSSTSRTVKKSKTRKGNKLLSLKPEITTATGKFVIREKSDNITPSLKCKENASWDVEPQIQINITSPKLKKKKDIGLHLSHNSALDQLTISPALNGIKIPTKRQTTKSNPIKNKSKRKINLQSEACLTSQTVSPNEDNFNDIDDEKVSVKGLTFKQLCSQYTSKRNEQSQNPYTFCIPQKFYELDEESVESQVENESQENIEDIKSIKRNCETESLNSPPEQDSMKEDHDSEEYAGSNELSNSDSVTENLITPSDQHAIDEIFDASLMTEVNNTELNEATDEDDNEEQNTTKLPLVFDLKNSEKLVILPHLDQRIYFHGLCLVEVLHGQLEILGSHLTKKSGPTKIYSPRGAALLYIRNDAKLIAYNTLTLAELLPKRTLNKTKSQISFHQHAAIFVCKELREPYLDFVERYIPQIIFPETVHSSEPRINFKLAGAWNRLRVSTNWEEILERVTESGKVAICGGKGVGKSTFMRYAINVLLLTFKKVRVVDLDPGQAEFVPPGCVYSVIIDQPLLGPNYTHLQSPDNMFLSNIDLGHNMKHYLTTVEYLLNETEDDGVTPTLVNFPGYSQDIGLDIAANILALLQPTLVVEMKSQNATKNYRMDLTVDNIRSCLETSDLPSNRASEEDLSYDYVKLDGPAKRSTDTWTLEGRQAREICIFAYFGQMMNENAKYFTSSDITMHSIQLSALTVLDCDGKPISAMAINGNLVALCSLPRDATDIFRCHGYGFVRGLDLKTDILVLMTPEPTTVLEGVTHLVLSSVSSPPSLIMTTQSVKGRIPFVNVGELIDFGQFTKRPYLPSKK